jgi:hypothetical protein
MKKTIVILTAAALAAALAGCGNTQSYLYTQPHNERYEEDVNADALTVDNYYGLKNAILSFVESGTEEGIIRSYSYDGDIADDLETAAYEVTRVDPVGAYAVDYMTHDCNRIVSYYEIRISITFRRTAEEIAAIVRASGTAEAEDLIVQALEDGQQSLVLRMSYSDDFSPQQIVQDAQREDPLLSIGAPSVTVQVYPESGVQRIVEMQFDYDASAAILVLEREQSEQVLEELSRFIAEEANDRNRMSIFYRRLCNRCTYTEGEDGNIYDALVTCSAGSKGIAEAFAALCTGNGLDCTIITGQKQGKTHWWNQVTLDGQTYHVDLTASMEIGKSTLELLYDDYLYGAYNWDTATYPACARPEEPEKPEEPEETESTEPEQETESEPEASEETRNFTTGAG